MAENRRAQTRHDVSLIGQLTINGEVREVTVVNVSTGGALISAGAKFPMGARASLAFSIPTLDAPIEIGATVRWSDDKATGLQFDGLRARDVWGLNEYFKQLSLSAS